MRMKNTIDDEIGRGYSQHRHADPRIVDAIVKLLRVPSGSAALPAPSLNYDASSGRHPIKEFPQTTPTVRSWGQLYFDLLNGENLVLYADEELRRQALNAVSIETLLGWRIAKEKSSLSPERNTDDYKPPEVIWEEIDHFVPFRR